MKILVLRLYDTQQHFPEMKKIHYENDDSIFITYNSEMQEDIRYSDRLFEVKGVESYVPGVLDKTIKAFEYFLNHTEFDYVVRTNISTVIDMKKLEDKLRHVTSKHVYGGHVFRAVWINEQGGITPEVFEKIKGTEFVSGTSIILSRLMCEYIVNNSRLLNYSIVDDVSIGLLMQKMNGPNLYLSFSEGNGLIQNCCFYRFKTTDRLNDALSIAKQYDLFKY